MNTLYSKLPMYKYYFSLRFVNELFTNSVQQKNLSLLQKKNEKIAICVRILEKCNQKFYNICQKM